MTCQKCYRSGKPRFAKVLVFDLLCVAVLLAFLNAPLRSVGAQEPVSGPIEGEVKSGPSAALAKAKQQEVQKYIRDLGSSSFRTREGAVVALLKIGPDALPLLLQAVNSSTDAEVRLRSTELVARLSKNDFESAAKAFLANTDGAGNIPGWDFVRLLLGDSPASRELFVEAARDHRELIASLSEGHQRIGPVWAKTAERIQQRVMVEFKPAKRSDITALLLACGEPLAQVSPSVEELIGRIVSGPITSETLADKRLSQCYRRMLGFWIRRASEVSHTKAVYVGMQNDIPETLDVAMRHLDQFVRRHRAALIDRGPEEQHDGETLADNELDALELALLAIARFGDSEDVYIARPLLNDARIMKVSPYFLKGRPLEVRVSDVASAVIIRLLRGDLEEAGFPDAQSHARMAFNSGSLGFPRGDQTARIALDQYVQRLMKRGKGDSSR